jgi:hypothetical protein
MARGWLSPWAIYNAATGLFRWENDDATPKWDYPNRNGNVLLHESTDDPYVKFCEVFASIRAEDADYIRAGQDLSAAYPITFTIDKQPDVPRNLTWAFVSHANITGWTIIFTGTNAKGNAITETKITAAGWSGVTIQAFATITSIVMITRVGTGVGDTINIGIGSKLGLANNINSSSDILKVSKNIAAAPPASDYPAASITVNTTYDTVDVSTGAAIVDSDTYTIWYKSRFYTID